MLMVGVSQVVAGEFRNPTVSIKADFDCAERSVKKL